MKTKNPNPFAGFPHHTPGEINDILEYILREQYGPQAEAMIMITRITQQFMADQEVAAVQPKRSQE